MARITLDRLAHSYLPHPSGALDFALKPMDHVWEDGQAHALLGPSGCGKTTLLNIISGLLRPTQGKVLFNGRDVTELSTRDRNIAQVFQFPVVYDNMTVYDNLAFPLRNRKQPEALIRPRVLEVAEMLDLASTLQSRARDLSPDTRQRISMGRGLVRTDVTAILFDEPLTTIDPHQRIALRRQLKEVQKRRNLTLIYVTHDQTEALTFADNVVVMHDGEVVQVGTPEALFRRPAHTFVGYFIGSPGMNLMACKLDGPFAVVGSSRIRVGDDALTRAQGLAGTLELGIRPEFLRLRYDHPHEGIPVNVVQVGNLGSHRIVTASMGDHILRVKITDQDKVREGPGWLVFPPEDCLLFHESRLI